MENENRRDLRISGSGSAPGDTYKNAIINGEGKINGNLDCDDFITNGTSEINGSVKAVNFTVRGASSVGGKLQAEEIKIGGSVDIQRNVSVKKMKISGSADIGGSITAEKCVIKGYFKVKGDCEAEVFVAKGEINIGGMLNAGNIEIDHYGDCRVKEIGGEKITVKEYAAFGLHKIIKFFHSPGKLFAETIEGDYIYLENTSAKTVRGSNIKIGPGCEIELVEYANSFEQEEGALVRENKKV